MPVTLPRTDDATDPLFRSHPNAMLVYDPATLRVLDVNDSALTAYGYTRGEFLALRITDLRPPEEVERLFAKLAEPRRGWRRSGVWKHRRKNGQIFHAEIASHEITWAGRPAVLVSAADITDRVESESAARRAEAHMNEAQRMAQVGSWQWQIAGDHVTWSEELFRIFGLDPTRGAPRWAAQRHLYAPGDWDRLNCAVERTCETGEPFELEVEIRRPDGTARWVVSRSTVIRGSQGEIIGLHGTAHDITVRRRAFELLQKNEAELRAANERLEHSEHRYRELLENLNEIVWAIDLSGVVTYLSPNAEQFGYRVADLLGQRFDRIVHPDDLPGVLDAVQKARSGAPTRIEYRAFDGAGGVHHVRSSFRATFENGHPTGFQGVLADITDQRRAEEQLRASQRLEAVGRLAGGIAHDFNNLLVVINGYAELAMQRLTADDPLHHDMVEIFGAGSRAASLTQKLLAFSRKQLLRPTVVSLNDVVNGTASMLKRVIGEDIAFELDLAPDLPKIFIDAGQLEHALMNLVVNARDAMPDGGRLLIRTARHHDAGEHTVVLSVEDTGHGMDEATRARIFEPFFTTKPVGRGTGLGLPLVYGFVKQSGGSLHVRTAPGQGSTFSLVLEGHPESDPTDGTSPEQAVLRGQERVLVVEDEPGVRELTGRLLSAAGYSLVLAASPEDALAVLSDPTQRIDLLLTDVVMPNMRGPELARRAAVLRPGLKVLYMSGYPNSSATAGGPPHPTEQTLNKPFTAAELTTAIRAALGPWPGATRTP